MKPYLHGLVSVKHWGGKPEDYQAVHDFLDCSKSAHPDMRHRAILHNSLGCYIAERVFGVNIRNSDGKLVSVRDIAERHIIDDMGRIPTLSDYLDGMPYYEWLGGPARKPAKHLAPDLEPARIPEIPPSLTPARELELGLKRLLRDSRRKPYDPYDPSRTID